MKVTNKSLWLSLFFPFVDDLLLDFVDDLLLDFVDDLLLDFVILCLGFFLRLYLITLLSSFE